MRKNILKILGFIGAIGAAGIAGLLLLGDAYPTQDNAMHVKYNLKKNQKVHVYENNAASIIDDEATGNQGFICRPNENATPVYTKTLEENEESWFNFTTTEDSFCVVLEDEKDFRKYYGPFSMNPACNVAYGTDIAVFDINNFDGGAMSLNLRAKEGGYPDGTGDISACIPTKDGDDELFRISAVKESWDTFATDLELKLYRATPNCERKNSEDDLIYSSYLFNAEEGKNNTAYLGYYSAFQTNAHDFCMVVAEHSMGVTNNRSVSGPQSVTDDACALTLIVGTSGTSPTYRVTGCGDYTSKIAMKKFDGDDQYGVGLYETDKDGNCTTNDDYLQESYTLNTGHVDDYRHVSSKKETFCLTVLRHGPDEKELIHGPFRHAAAGENMCEIYLNPNSTLFSNTPECGEYQSEIIMDDWKDDYIGNVVVYRAKDNGTCPTAKDEQYQTATYSFNAEALKAFRDDIERKPFCLNVTSNYGAASEPLLGPYNHSEDANNMCRISLTADNKEKSTTNCK